MGTLNQEIIANKNRKTMYIIKKTNYSVNKIKKKTVLLWYKYKKNKFEVIIKSHLTNRILNINKKFR